MTEEEALRLVIQRHRTSEGLNAFCRIALALNLEPFFREGAHRPQLAAGNRKPPSNLTNVGRGDVRADLALAAGVSTGNVTKVKQILDTVMPETRERLLRGEVSIHRAWLWRTLTAKGQRDALWKHLYQGETKKTIRRLIRQHKKSGPTVRPGDVASTVLRGLATFESPDFIVAVVDVPGRAVLVARELYEELAGKTTDGSR